MLIPIMTPNINYKEFLKTCKHIIPYNLTTKLDIKGIDAQTENGFIFLLAQLENKDDELKLIHKRLFKHIYYGFLTVQVQSVLMKLLSKSFLKITYGESIRRDYYSIYLTGSILNFIELIKDNDCDLVDLIQELSQFFNIHDQKITNWKISHSS